MSTGSLGMGISAGIGMALAARLGGRDYRVYVVRRGRRVAGGPELGGLHGGAQVRVDEPAVIVDRNGVQLDGPTDLIMPMLDIGEKIRQFGWEVAAATATTARAF